MLGRLSLARWPTSIRTSSPLLAWWVTGARAIWSQWEGYLERESGQNFQQELARREIPFEQIHTSGHASISDLKRLTEVYVHMLIDTCTREELRGAR